MIEDCINHYWNVENDVLYNIDILKNSSVFKDLNLDERV